MRIWKLLNLGTRVPTKFSTRAARSHMQLDRISARRIVCMHGELAGNADSGELNRCIGFPNRVRYLLVGTGTTVPAGIEKYFKSYKQSTNLAYQP